MRPHPQKAKKELDRGLNDAPMLFDGDAPSREFDGFKLSGEFAGALEAIPARSASRPAARTAERPR